MANDTLKAGIPVLALYDGMQIVFEAFDPTTGAAVTGVVVSNVAIYGDDLATTADELVTVPPLAGGLLPA